MSKRRFDLITNHLTFTNWTRPTYLDKFWEVRQMLAAFNAVSKQIELSSNFG